MFFKPQLMMLLESLHFKQQSMRVIADGLSLGWYIGYNLHESLPGPASLIRIRISYDSPLLVDWDASRDRVAGGDESHSCVRNIEDPEPSFAALGAAFEEG